MTLGSRADGSTGSSDKSRQIRHMAISLATMLLLVGVVFVFNVPNPNMLLITGLAVCTSLYGFPSGIVCAIVMIVYSMYFFSTDHSMFAYTALNLEKMAVIVLGVALTTVFIGNLKRQQEAATRKLREMNESLAEDNATLQAATTTDDLTGVRNRFALRRDYSRFANRDVHVMMVDLDDFKGFNDQYGHQMGDKILRQLSLALVESFGGEWCYRYGGDEFLIIMPDVQESDFLAKLENLKRRVKGIDVDGRHLPVHFSAGYVHGVCELSYDLRLMMHQADSNLYDAKALGKDCCVGHAFSRVFAEALPENADGFGGRMTDV